MSVDPKIFLDMDGVLVDLVRGLHEVHGKSENYHNWPHGEYDVAKIWKIPSDDLWRPCGSYWWATLPVHEEYEDIMTELVGFDVTIVSSPLQISALHRRESITGKLQWLERHMPRYLEASKWVFTDQKHLLAGNGILIDDSGVHVGKFRNAYGEAILFPRLWNELWFHDTYERRMAHFKYMLRKLVAQWRNSGSLTRQVVN